AFGYYGFLKGARKEYAESYRYHHKKAASVYISAEQRSSFYPVPEPMWPDREIKQHGKRKLDVVLLGDFRKKPENNLILELKALKEMHLRIGLIQMGEYDLSC